jgi:hypothetical protein
MTALIPASKPTPPSPPHTHALTPNLTFTDTFFNRPTQRHCWS